ncbi:hypothetical protein ES703_93940 [subsurface metagenome]
MFNKNTHNIRFLSFRKSFIPFTNRIKNFSKKFLNFGEILSRTFKTASVLKNRTNNAINPPNIITEPIMMKNWIFNSVV